MEWEKFSWRPPQWFKMHVDNHMFRGKWVNREISYPSFSVLEWTGSHAVDSTLGNTSGREPFYSLVWKVFWSIERKKTIWSKSESKLVTQMNTICQACQKTNYSYPIFVQHGLSFRVISSLYHHHLLQMTISAGATIKITFNQTKSRQSNLCSGSSYNNHNNLTKRTWREEVWAEILARDTNPACNLA